MKLQEQLLLHTSSKKFKRIRELCLKFSYLKTAEINKIIVTAKGLEVCADAFGYDIFIDIPSKNRDEAIVVYHANAHTPYSLYNDSPVGQKALRENEPGVLRTLETGVHTKNIKARTQENRYVIQNIYPIRYGKKVIGTIITEHDTNYGFQRDFNVHKHAFPALSSTLDSIKNINNHLDDAIMIYDRNGNLQFKNVKADTLYKVLGYMEDIKGEHYDNLSLDGTTFCQVTSKPAAHSYENREVNIRNYYFLVKKVFIPEEDLCLAVIMHDITQLKDREMEIVLKTVAIGEIHHRIKNNLQTIASLLRLQSRRSSNIESRTILKDSVNRILSIASTHELLSSQMSDDISLKKVIENVCDNIRRCYAERENIHIEIKANEDFPIDSDRATVLALIVNELVQNCYDHAFSSQQKGMIKVSLKKQHNTITVTVMDNGKGYNGNEEIMKSLGLTIVKTYVKDKLKGTIEFQSNRKGTIVSLQFQLNKFETTAL